MSYFIQKRNGKKFVSAYNGHYYVSANNKKINTASLTEMIDYIKNIDYSNLRVSYDSSKECFNIQFPKFSSAYVNYVRMRYGKPNGVVFRLVRYGKHNNSTRSERIRKESRGTIKSKVFETASYNKNFNIFRPNGSDGNFSKVEFFLTPDEAARGSKKIYLSELNLDRFFCKTSLPHFPNKTQVVFEYLFGFELLVREGVDNPTPFVNARETNMIKINPNTHAITT